MCVVKDCLGGWVVEWSASRTHHPGTPGFDLRVSTSHTWYFPHPITIIFPSKNVPPPPSLFPDLTV